MKSKSKQKQIPIQQLTSFDEFLINQLNDSLDNIRNLLSSDELDELYIQFTEECFSKHM